MTLDPVNSSNPLKGLTDDQISEIVELNNTLDQEEANMIRQEIAEKEIKEMEISSLRKPFRRLRKTPLEIINRIFFFLFLGGFLFSFASAYATNKIWFLLYIISAFSCIFYTPNRKALKELLAAWPNIEDLIKNRSLWKK